MTITFPQIYKAIRRLGSDLERKPLPEEVATEVGMAVENLYYLAENIDWRNAKNVG